MVHLAGRQAKQRRFGRIAIDSHLDDERQVFYNKKHKALELQSRRSKLSAKMHYGS